MRLRWKYMAIALAVFPAVLLVVTWIGFFNVGASTGHWKITEWFLHFAMRSAVRTYALAVAAPERLPPGGIQPAAAHFARGCAICHGAPGEPRSPGALAMLPRPPDLAGIAGKWEDAELFRIVKHGVRFTGMPAWPTQTRDDEVWAMVAFLRDLPAMEPAIYRRLAYGEGMPPAVHVTGLAQALDECIRCHGADGMGKSPLVPVLAGQNETYLLESLRSYAAGHRASGIMQLSVLAIDPVHLPALARHFAGQARKALVKNETDRLRRGEAIALNGRPADKVPACAGCHSGGKRNPAFPALEGQSAPYIATQLRLFREDRRGGTRFSHLMENAAGNLSDTDIDDVAAYFSNLSPND